MKKNAKEENITIIKWFCISTIISLVSIVGLLLIADSVDFNSSDGSMFLWFFGGLSIVFGLIAGTYKHNKFKKEKGIDLNKKVSAEEEFEIQVKNYDNLSVAKSKKGQAVLAICFFVSLTLIFAFFDIIPLSDALAAVIIYGILSIFIYKGHRWAMVSTMFMWTLDKGYQLIQMDGKGIIGIFFFWLFLMSLLYQAIIVENDRIKLKNEARRYEANDNDKGEAFYCSACGKALSAGVNFCKFCGKNAN